MKAYIKYIVCFCLIIVGVLCTINIVNTFNVHSSEYGKSFRIEQQQQTELSKFDDVRLTSFETQDYSVYKTVTTFAHEEFDGRDKNIALTVNEQPATDVTVSSGKVTGVFELNFYNLDGDKITTAQVNIAIEYYASQTVVTITVRNENDSLAYLNAYVEINGFVLRVLERGTK